MIIDLHCLSILVWKDDLTLSPTYLDVSSSITFTQDVKKNVRTRKASNNLALNHSVVIDRSVVNLSVGNTLNLSQDGRKTPISIDILQGYVLWHSAQDTDWQKIHQSIGLTHSVIGIGAKAAKNQLSLVQTLGLQAIRNIEITSNLNLLSSSNVWGNDSRFILPVIDTYTPATTVRFTFGGFTFTVKPPDWSDSKKLEFSRINQRSRGGDLIIYRDPGWPESITLKMTFVNLKESEKELFKILYRISIGLDIFYQDHFGQVWSGIILNPGEALTQTGRGQWTANIELQGSKL